MRRGSASILADSGAGFSRALAGAAATLKLTVRSGSTRLSTRHTTDPIVQSRVYLFKGTFCLANTVTRNRSLPTTLSSLLTVF